MPSAIERPLLVPYVTSWTTETDMPFEVVYRRGGGIACADEIVADRDELGILWTRTYSRQRDGRPEFGKVHSLRQRRAMRRLLCQVCGEPADQSDDGVLWLLPDYRGVRYEPGPTAPVMVEPVVVSFEDHAIRWIRAAGLVLELLGCTLLSLEEL
jgi:hypothetical protein